MLDNEILIGNLLHWGHVIETGQTDKLDKPYKKEFRNAEDGLRLVFSLMSRNSNAYKMALYVTDRFCKSVLEPENPSKETIAAAQKISDAEVLSIVRVNGRCKEAGVSCIQLI